MKTCPPLPEERRRRDRVHNEPQRSALREEDREHAVGLVHGAERSSAGVSRINAVRRVVVNMRCNE